MQYVVCEVFRLSFLHQNASNVMVGSIQKAEDYMFIFQLIVCSGATVICLAFGQDIESDTNNLTVDQQRRQKKLKKVVFRTSLFSLFVGLLYSSISHLANNDSQDKIAQIIDSVNTRTDSTLRNSLKLIDSINRDLAKADTSIRLQVKGVEQLSEVANMSVRALEGQSSMMDELTGGTDNYPKLIQKIFRGNGDSVNGYTYLWDFYLVNEGKHNLNKVNSSCHMNVYGLNKHNDEFLNYNSPQTQYIENLRPIEKKGNYPTLVARFYFKRDQSSNLSIGSYFSVNWSHGFYTFLISLAWDYNWDSPYLYVTLNQGKGPKQKLYQHTTEKIIINQTGPFF